MQNAKYSMKNIMSNVWEHHLSICTKYYTCLIVLRIGCICIGWGIVGRRDGGWEVSGEIFAWVAGGCWTTETEILRPCLRHF